MKHSIKLLRITTVPISLKLLLRGQLAFMKQNGFEVLSISADGPEVNSIVSSGIAHKSIPITRRITPFTDVYAVLLLIREIRRFRPAIVHTQTPKAGLLGMIAAFICGVPARLHTVGGLPLVEQKGLKRSLLWAAELLTYRLAHKVFINSTGLRKIIEDKVGMKDKITMIGHGSTNGIDTAFFQRSDELLLNAQALREGWGVTSHVVFSFVGRIVKDKGINELITAFGRLSLEIPVKLVLVGPFESELDPVSQETIDALKTHPDIICMGYQEDVRPALVSSDVFVFPSYREGFPNVLLQACCLNIPCVVTDINGSNEIIKEGVNGLIVEPKNVTQLYLAMKKLAVDPELRSLLGRNSRSMIAREYDQAFVWNCLLTEYQKHTV